MNLDTILRAIENAPADDLPSIFAEVTACMADIGQTSLREGLRCLDAVDSCGVPELTAACEDWRNES